MRLTMLVVVIGLALGCGPDGSGRTGGNGGGGGSGGNGAGGSGGSGGSGGGGGASNTFATMCNGKATTISGAVLAPNGVDPISNAFAYVPASTGKFPAGVACELCGMPIDGAAATATTNADGTFKLDISQLPEATQLPFTVDKGRFRRQSMLTITPCQDNPVGAPSTVLPGKPGPGDDIPKIAVSSGNVDQLDAVLVAMGLDQNQGFDCYEGRKSSTTQLKSPCGQKGALPAIETLLTDATKLATYNIVFLACAPGKFASLPPTTQMTIAMNLRDWTGKGGRLFATDNSYDYVAQAFPNDVMFSNGNSSIDAANVGVGGTSSQPKQYSGRVNDMTLLAWLVAVSAIPQGQNTLMLDGYLNKWSAIASVPSTTADEVDATNAVLYSSGTTQGSPATYPQSVRFDVTPPGAMAACGRTIYTSYHTLPSTTMVDATHLAPQERILEYLMFEAGACVGTIN